MNGFCGGGFPSGNGGGILGGISPMILIIVFLLFTQCGGCGRDSGCGNSGGGLFGCDSSIFIILILFCCMGGNMGGCGVCESK